MFLGGLLLYVFTLAPSLVFGDPAEYIFVPHIWGVLHPPGYAFMTLLVKAWQTLVPIGTLAYRSNLLAAAAGAGAAALVGVAAQHAAGKRPVIGLLAPSCFLLPSLSLLAAPDFWQHSLHANAHIVTALLAASALFLLLRWGAGGGDRWLYAFGLVAGLSVTHHPLLTLSFPAYAVYILTIRPGLLRDWRALLKLLGAGLLGLLPWAYFPLPSLLAGAGATGSGATGVGATGPVAPTWPGDLNTLTGFLNLVLARGLTGVNLFAFGWGEQGQRLIVFWSLLRLQFSLPVIALAALGLGVLWRRAWRAGLLFTLLLALNLGFVFNSVQDVQAYFLPSLTAIALLAGVGASAVLRVDLTGFWRPVRSGPGILLLLIPLAGLAQNLPRVSLRGERAADAFVQGVFERWAGKGQHAVLLSDWEHMTPLWYARFVEGRALDPADLTPVYVAGTSASPWVDAIWAHIGDGPIYLIEYRRDVIEAGFRLRAEGDSLWRRALPPAEALVPPPIPYPLAAQAGPIRLLGFDLAPTGGTPPGGTVRLILYFTAPRTPSDILQPVARLGPWTYAYTTDSHLLTPYWTPGEVVGERWDFTLPLDAAPGDYPLSLSIANLTAGEGLPWEGGRDDLPLATVRVESGIRSPRGETAGLAANFGQREGLVGARVKLGGGEWVGAPWPVPIQVRAGEGIEIRLRWRALLPDQSSRTAFIHLLDAGNQVWAGRDDPPLEGAFTTLLWFPRWLPGQEVTDPYRLSVPADAPPGDYTLEVGLYGLRNIQRVPLYDEAGNMAGDRFVPGGLIVVP